jgi:alkanesulfonate monooxygenase SsuD/methylene tetrahydromethanopterin reductase-like flavin-dependent oxidoreductase (luciferase family)
LARLAERGKFDGIFLADSVGVYDLYRGPAPSIAGPTGIWRGVRDGMGCDLCIALGRRLCRSTVAAFERSSPG